MSSPSGSAVRPIRLMQLLAVLLLGFGSLALAGSAGAQEYDSGSTTGDTSTSGDTGDTGDTGTTGTTGDSGTTDSPSSPSGPVLTECPPAAGGLTLVSGALAPGSDFVVSGDGYAPDSDIDLYVCSTPVLIGNAIADADGRFEGGSTVPTDLEAGVHQIVAYGLDPDGNPLAKDISFEVPATDTGTTGDTTDGGSGDLPTCEDDYVPNGVTSIPQSDPRYRDDLDNDNDGFACDGTRTSTSSGTTASATSASTGVGTAVGGTAQSPASSGALGRTGSSAVTMAVVAAAVVLLGSALVLGARRRRNQA